MWLIVNPGLLDEKEHPLPEGPSTIGRTEENSIRVLHMSLSRKHARLERHGDSIVLVDLGSKNGTLVNGVRVDRVLTSRWCRARETATLMDLGPVTEAPMLDSFFADRSREPAQTAALRQFLAGMAPRETVVMVSHQVNISALTGEAPASGEAAVIAPVAGKPGVFTVKGWLNP